ncbi:MAG: hypothetical protein IJP63_08565 [Acholeplasmatales bacterium]|jgi:hypothetical protein|nr:hypothetical protein [Acholeplasmatales bacterium]MBR6288396.1 hypothetical protein [Acholeplasmatales bacterium]
MINKDEALKLEKLDNYIDEKINSLKDYNDSYEFFLRKLNTFVNEYSKKVSEFSDMINKNIDEMHKSIDSFKTIYSDSINELNNKKKSILEMNPEFDGEESKILEDELNRKLISETDKLKNNVNKLLENYLLEYKKTCDNIAKLNQRLNKLKDRSYND